VMRPAMSLPSRMCGAHRRYRAHGWHRAGRFRFRGYTTARLSVHVRLSSNVEWRHVADGRSPSSWW
jgi:hypothetical protein